MAAESIQYDAKVIEEFAARQYRRARGMTLRYGALGFLLGLVLAGILYQEPETKILPPEEDGSVTQVKTEASFTLSLVAWIVSTMVGVAIGNERGFTLRLQAQTSLCHVQIERNTSRGVAT